MPKIGQYVPAAILLVGCAFIWNMRSQAAVPLAAPLSAALPNVPGYDERDLHLTDEERRVLGNTDYMARMYVRDSVLAFTTFVSYYERQTQGKTIHSPRNCLPGAGWEVLTAGVGMVAVDGVAHEVNRYELKNGADKAVVYYWYQGRGRVVANEYTVKWNLLRDAMLAGHTEEALVRVMVPVTPDRSVSTQAGERRQVAAADSLGVEISQRLMREVAHALPGAGGTSVRGVALR